jgi:hypothetical protein
VRDHPHVLLVDAEELDRLAGVNSETAITLVAARASRGRRSRL